MKISITRFRTVIFYFPYLFMLCFSTYGHIPVLGGYLNLLADFGVFVLIILFLFKIKLYTKKELLIFFALFIYSFIMIRTANFYGFFKLTLLMAASKGIDFRYCIKYDLIFRTIILVIMIFLFYQGIAPDVTSLYNNQIRHSMGFQNVNHLGMMVFIIVMEIIYLTSANLNILQYIYCIFLLIFTDITSGSRTAEFMTIISLMFATLYKVNPNLFKKKSVKIFIKHCSVICSIITLLFVYLYKIGTEIGLHFDRLFSGRLSNILFYYDQFGITLFGTDVSTATRTNDNFYAYCLLTLGIITFIFVIFFCYKMINEIYKNNIPLAITLACFMLYGLSERLWMYIDYNILLLSFKILIDHGSLENVLVKNRKYRIKLNSL